MGECFVSGAGGAKEITRTDCSISTSRVTLPNNLTWGDLKHFLAVGWSPMGDKNCRKNPKTGKMETFNGSDWVLIGVSYQPEASSNSFKLYGTSTHEITTIGDLLALA